MRTLEIGARPLRTSSLVDLAYEDLQLRIASGALKEGERLVIDALAREFGTSQIPVREALVRLNAERFVTFERNKGYRVAPKPDALEMQQLFEARLILEIGAVDHGLATIDDKVLAELSAINRELARIEPGRALQDYRDFIMLNERFHLVLVGLSGNPYVIDAYNRLGYHQRILQTLYGKGVPDSDRIIREHDEIIAALGRRRPADVQQAIRSHIMAGAARLPIMPG